MIVTSPRTAFAVVTVAFTATLASVTVSMWPPAPASPVMPATIASPASSLVTASSVVAKPVQAHQATATWAALADCESGLWDRHGHPIPGTARWDDRSGGYEGGVHFAPSTWDENRLPDMAANAADAHVWTQVWVAEKVLARQGWRRAWPKCSKKIGMRR